MQDSSGDEREADAPAGDAVVVITGTRIPTPVEQVGNAVTVVSSEQILREQHRSVVDALQRVPGLTIRRSSHNPGSRAAIFMRGTNSDQTLVLVDGIKAHDPSAPNREPLIEHLESENIDRIEVLRGPQSTLYGSEAIGGVINIVTKRGSGPLTASAWAEAGSFDTVTGGGSARGSNGPVDYSLNVSRFDTRGFSVRSADREPDSYRNSSFVGRFGIAPTDEIGADVYFRYITAELETDTGSDLNLSGSDVDQVLVRLEPRLSLMGGAWTQKLGLSFHDIARDTQGAGFAAPASFDGRVYTLDWQHTFYPYDWGASVLGFEYEVEEATFKPSGSSGIEADTSNAAVYGQQRVEFWSDTFAVLGLRLDDHEDFGTKATYSLSAAHRRPRWGTTLRASVGTAFKAPSLAQLFDDTFGANNPDLQPEESIGFDFGVEQRFDLWQTTIGATYFYNEIDDMIVGVFPDFTNINIEEARTSGVEVAVALTPGRNVSIDGSYTYTDTEATNAASFGIEDGSRLLRRPDHAFDLNAAWSLPDGRTRLNTTLRYIGERDDLDPETFATVVAEDYLVADLAASYELSDAVELYARVENLLDESYEDILGFKAPGASVFGGLRLRR